MPRTVQTSILNWVNISEEEKDRLSERRRQYRGDLVLVREHYRKKPDKNAVKGNDKKKTKTKKSIFLLSYPLFWQYFPFSICLNFLCYDAILLS